MVDISKMRPRLVAHYSQHHDKKTTEALVEAHMSGFYTGREHGQTEAQRAIQLALGVVEPTNTEAAIWNLPLPLKGG